MVSFVKGGVVGGRGVVGEVGIVGGGGGIVKEGGGFDISWRRKEFLHNGHDIAYIDDRTHCTRHFS